jgi:GntR family transcriptional regulator, transcriptional repressor for pyruvate dehydrogenase complex
MMIRQEGTHRAPIGDLLMSPLPQFNVERLVAPGSLTDRVNEALTKLVTGGEYPPGARLPTENEMAERFGVSRTVIREAVARLKSAGLVESKQGSGVYVREPNAEMPFRIDPGAFEASTRSVLEIVELRRGLEAEAAALAAERCSRAQLADIRSSLKEIERAEAAGRDGVDADMAFHRAIARATGNRHYPALWDFIGQFLRGAMRATRANEARRADFAAQVREEHHAIVEAIARRDPAGARAAALRHMEMAAVRMKASEGAAGEGAPRRGERRSRSTRREPA